MTYDGLSDLIERKNLGEAITTGDILDRIARDVYARPRLYGFKSEEDVGELFERYLPRIIGMVERYENIGSSFEAYLISSLKYMSISIRRKKAWAADREAVYLADRQAEDQDYAWSARRKRRSDSTTVAWSRFPHTEDADPLALAFRRRITYVCVKCANMIDDGKASMIARAVGLDEDELLSVLAKARSQRLGVRTRSFSRRRGRNAAWLRICVNRRRLGRETDADARHYLEEAIERDRGKYMRTIALMAKSTPIISNKAVAQLLGVPKGTVDCGVGRILKQFSELSTDVDEG